MNIAVVTGTRAEWGIWRGVVRAMVAARRLEVGVVVTGMHLLKEFGETWREVERDLAGMRQAEHASPRTARRSMAPILTARTSVASGAYDLGHRDTETRSTHRGVGLGVVKVRMYGEAGEDKATALGRGVMGVGRALNAMGADVVMVLGDRLEMMAAASAAMAQQRIICHVHGGETAPGQFDEQIRHAITKMAHVHFAATETAGGRIVQMGEDRRHVHVVGAPALDELVGFVKNARAGGIEPPARATQPRAAVPHRVRPLLVLHPSSADEGLEEKRAALVVRELVRRFGAPIEVIGPNNDPGHRGILRAYAAAGEKVRLTMSLAQEAFWGAVMRGGLLVGNSSAGIIEAATLGVPVVNVGERQAGRERNLNVVDVAFTAVGLRRGLDEALSDNFAARAARGENLYGDGKAAGRIVRVLEKLDVQGLRRAKRFCDRP